MNNQLSHMCITITVGNLEGSAVHPTPWPGGLLVLVLRLSLLGGGQVRVRQVFPGSSSDGGALGCLDQQRCCAVCP